MTAIDRSIIQGRDFEYVVLDRASAEDGSEMHDRTLVISVTEPGAREALLPIPESCILRVSFTDAQPGDGAQDCTHFDEAMAGSIAEFVLANRSVPRVIVHCLAGMSRSAGIVCGIAEGLGDRAVADICSQRFVPNPHVRHLVREAIRSRLS
jgi:predicted protein tyrosine phosphatase